MTAPDMAAAVAHADRLTRGGLAIVDACYEAGLSVPTFHKYSPSKTRGDDDLALDVLSVVRAIRLAVA